MEQQYCLNLCDIGKRLQKKNGKMDLEEKICKEQDYRRIYIGSYFCGKYFLQMLEADIKNLKAFCEERARKVTLVIPVFSEKDLALGLSKIHEIMDLLGDVLDECTFNDFGMMAYLSRTYEVKLNLGRLLMKDYRDPRYPEYFNMVYKPKLFHEYMDDWIKNYNITGIEMDPTHGTVDLSEAKEGITLAIHLPYCYMTMGRICEYASIHKEIDQKFRPNMECHKECMENFIEYDLQDERRWIRVGRAIYFKNEEIKLINGLANRIIYFPIDWEVKE